MKHPVYERLGVRPIINAVGTLTRIGGSLMAPEVVQAMGEASRAFVSLKELQEKVGARIAELLGVEAAYVSCGASAGLALSIAACMTGTDLAKIDRLPDTTGMKNEVLMPLAYRNLYDRPIRTVGATIVTFGLSGYTFPWQLEAGLTERTAAVFLMGGHEASALPVEVVARIAHDHGVPVIVDAAAEVPPVENLTRYLRAGADIALFSGGKAIGGPQATGLVLGSQRIIEAVALNGPPDHGIGRPMKVAKEEMIGLLTALELYLARDHEADIARWQRYLACIAEAAASAPGVRCQTVYGTTDAAPVPRLEVILDAAEAQVTPEQAFNRLLYGEPRIRVAQAGRGLLVNPMMLREGEAEVVAQRVAEVLSSSRPEDAEIDGRITPHQWALDNLVL
jgi:uncharacterized pyridoxal phosphate-dependent enzyme